MTTLMMLDFKDLESCRICGGKFFSDKLVLKTNWCKENVYIDFNFLCNIKEIWNIIPIVPEDKFLEQDINLLIL